MKYFIITFILIFRISFSFFQSKPEDKFGGWYMFDGTPKVSNKFNVKTGIQLRSFEVIDNMNLLFYYTGISYHLNKKDNINTSILLSRYR